MRLFVFLFAVVLLMGGTLRTVFASKPLMQDDTVRVPDVTQVPIIDGYGTDDCWQGVSWQTIDQVWIPWGTTIQASDFSGRYKAVWSSVTNLLYIFLEVTDDMYIDGYIYNSNPSVGGGYPNYDLPEIFIDENRSKGLHVFDGTGDFANDWGTNAENAFSYHIMVNFPTDGQAVSDFVACDIAGIDWGNYFIANYASHFDGFIVRRSGNTTTWEMALKVYGEAYNPSNPEDSRIILTEGKVMGFSMAWCDNDQPDGTRDNFIGSVYVPENRYNDHWMNAEDFGVIKLMALTPVSSVHNKQATALVRTSYNASTRQIRIDSGDNGYLSIDILNTSGQIVARYRSVPGESRTISIDAAGLNPGIYLVRAVNSIQISTEKIIVF